MVERSSPRVTLNALAEYLTVPAGRRRSIVSEQKNPKAFRVAYYAEAEDAIIGALAGVSADDHLDRGRAKIQALPTVKEWDVARRDTQLEAIEAARAFIQTPQAAALRELKMVRQRTPPLLIGGVSVSVRPELIVQSSEGVAVGAVKLYLSKTSALTEERARYAGAILQVLVEKLNPDSGVIHSKCLVLDVFARRLYLAPRTHHRRRQDISAACAEIAAIWSAEGA